MARIHKSVCGVCGKSITMGPQDIQRGWPDYCPHCDTPLWPLEKNFTGNSREDIMKFVEDHDYNGKPLNEKE